MKERLMGFLKTYFLFVCIFALQKPFFMLFYRKRCAMCSWTEWLVMRHGLPLDSVACRLSDALVSGIALARSAWLLCSIFSAVYGAVTFYLRFRFTSIIFTVDLGLYEYWGSLDRHPLFISPTRGTQTGYKSAERYTAHSASQVMDIRRNGMHAACIRYLNMLRNASKRRLTGRWWTISIRGGFTHFTITCGVIDTNQRLNHAAIRLLPMRIPFQIKGLGSQYRLWR